MSPPALVPPAPETHPTMQTPPPETGTTSTSTSNGTTQVRQDGTMNSDKPQPRLRSLMSALGKIETQVEPISSSKKPPAPETPTPWFGTFDERLCQEMAVSLFRYRASIPLIYLRDVKVSLPPHPACPPDCSAVKYGENRR